MKIEKYLFRIAGSLLGFSLFNVFLGISEKPEVLPYYNSLENKIWCCDKANNYLERVESPYLVSSVDLKRDSLILEKEEFENTLRYKNWKEKEKRRKEKAGLLLGLGLFGGFGVGYCVDRKRLKKK